jgi:hypothetical protein
MFNEFRPGVCVSNEKAASAKAETRPLGALSEKSVAQPHGRCSEQQQALAIAGLNRIFMHSNIAKWVL